MTVLGLGLDVVDVAAFGAQLADGASGFAEATFTPAERRAPAGSATPAPVRLAGRFAAKEAFVKAWAAARFGRPPAVVALDLRHVEVVADAWGRPALRLHGAAAAGLDALAAEHGPVRAHLSLSHDGTVAAAVVVLEVVVPAPWPGPAPAAGPASASGPAPAG